jgi:hypothetical protein
MVSFRQIMLLGGKAGQRPRMGLGGQVDPASLHRHHINGEPDDDAVDRRDVGKICPTASTM